MTRPDPIRLGRLIAYAKRPPTSRCPSWYWVVVRHEGDRQVSLKGHNRRGTVEEITVHLAGLVAAHGSRGPEDRQQERTDPTTLGELVRLWLLSQRARRDAGHIKGSTYRSSFNASRLALSAAV